MTQEEINEVKQIIQDYLNENGGVVEEVSEVTDEQLSAGNVISVPAYIGSSMTYVKVPISKLQLALVSGQNIKTINNTSIVGSGNITITGGGSSIEVDDELSSTSENPVQNKVITSSVSELQEKVFPLTLTFSAASSLLEYTGTAKSDALSFTVKRNNELLVPTTLSITQDGTQVYNTAASSGTYTASVNKSGTTTFVLTVTYGTMTASKSVTVRMYKKSYLGLSTVTAASGFSNYTTIGNGSLLTSATRNVTLQNGSTAQYIWIITPFTVSKVASDEAFVYPIEYSLNGTINGMNYYRSTNTLGANKTINVYTK